MRGTDIRVSGLLTHARSSAPVGAKLSWCGQWAWQPHITWIKGEQQVWFTYHRQWAVAFLFKALFLVLYAEVLVRQKNTDPDPFCTLHTDAPLATLASCWQRFQTSCSRGLHRLADDLTACDFVILRLAAPQLLLDVELALQLLQSFV